MHLYIGTKTLKARQMSRGEYNAYRGWELPADENPQDAGYLVEYTDGGKANHPDHEGYISWSPADVFNKSYVIVALYQTGKPPHVVRLASEYAELSARLDKLYEFLHGEIFKTLHEDERKDLRQQADLMANTQVILARRLERALK